MIVDTHVYCFRAPDHRAGHATPEEHLGYWQWGYALHAVAGVQLSRWLSGAVRDTKTAVKTFDANPIVSVVAKPRIGPVPN